MDKRERSWANTTYGFLIDPSILFKKGILIFLPWLALGLAGLSQSWAAGDSTSRMIAVVGLDSYKFTNNYADFFYEANAFLDVCEARLDFHQCLLFINDDANLWDRSRFKNPENLFEDLSQEAFQRLMGAFQLRLGKLKTKRPSIIVHPNRNRILEHFEEALLDSKPGDQVVLSFIGHGLPGLVKTSCFEISRSHVMSHLTESNFICAEDLDAILARSLSTGVKVFIDSMACFSGGLQALARPGVIIRTGSDRDGVSISFASNDGRMGLWATIFRDIQEMDKKTGFLKLGAVAKKSYQIGLNSTIGLTSGFTSDYLRKLRCGSFDQNREELQTLLLAPVKHPYAILASTEDSSHILNRTFNQIKRRDVSVDLSKMNAAIEEFMADARYQKSIADLKVSYQCDSGANERICSFLDQLRGVSKVTDALDLLKNLNSLLCWGPYGFRNIYNSLAWLSMKSYFAKQNNFFKFTQFQSQSFDAIDEQLDDDMEKINF